jgi:signal transduction histidine kinase
MLGLVLAVAGATAGGERITAARLIAVDTVGYQAPPATRPQGAGGKVVTLPYAPPPEWEPSVDAFAQRIATRDTWYALKVPPLPDDGRQLYLYIPRWKSDGSLAIYADHGWCISRTPTCNGTVPTSRSSSRCHAPPTRIRREPWTSGCSTCAALAVRSPRSGSEITGNWRRATTCGKSSRWRLPAFSAVAFLATGIFALFVWLSRRDERIYLLFFLMSAVCFLRMLHTFVGVRPLIVSDAWFGWITVNSLYWMVAMLHLFAAELHRRRQPILTLIILVNGAGWAIATLPGLLDPTLISLPIYLNIAVGLVVGINGMRQSAKAGSRFAMLLSVLCLITLVVGVYDLGLQQNWVNIESVFLTNFAGVGFTIIFWYIMFSRYVGALEVATQAKADLARRLAQREAELTASHARLRDVEHRELLHQERQRLMQDMHDGLGSTLVGALRAFESDHAADLDTVGILRGCIDDLKLTIDSMEPVETDLLLLLATLRFRLQPRLEAAGVKLTWDAGEVPPLEWLDQRHALHILRILQEAFANILKHSGAREVTVSVRAEKDQVLVRVRDDGQGFDPSLPLRGRGLANQLSRAEAIGGTIRWEPVSSGSVLAIALPVAKLAL